MGGAYFKSCRICCVHHLKLHSAAAYFSPSFFLHFPSLTTLSLFCPANYPSVPIIHSRHLFAWPFIFISTAATYQLAVSRETVITCAHVFCIQLTHPL